MNNKLSGFNTMAISEHPVADNPLVKTIDTYIMQIKYANATNLARTGHYKQAEALVSQILHDYGESPMLLDLRARIYAQQGRLFEADSIWRKALLFDDSNNAYLSSLRRISQMQRLPIWILPFFYLIVGLSIIVAFVVGTSFLTKNIKKNTTTASSSLTQPQAIEDKLVKLEKSIQGLISNSALTSPPKLDIRLSDISTREEGNDLIITFKQGLFERSDILKAGMISTITKLGKQIENYAGRVYIKIYGITNNIPLPAGLNFRDNIDLGKARANAVFDHFRENTNLPPDRILIGSYGEFLPPYPNDTFEGRAKNKTVVIRISHSTSN